MGTGGCYFGSCPRAAGAPAEAWHGLGSPKANYLLSHAQLRAAGNSRGVVACDYGVLALAATIEGAEGRVGTRNSRGGAGLRAVATPGETEAPACPYGGMELVWVGERWG